MYQNVSQEYRTEIGKNGRHFRARIMKMTDGQYVDQGAVIRELTYTGGTNGTDHITFGSVISASVEFTLYKPNFAIAGQEFKVEIGLDINGVPEWVPMGLFTAQRPIGDWEETKVVSYDRMQKFEKTYFPTITFPASTDVVIRDVCECFGVGYVLPTVNNSGWSATMKTKPVGYTGREVLSWIGCLLGMFAVITRDGKLRFRWYENSARIIPPNRYWEPATRTEYRYNVGVEEYEAEDESGTTITEFVRNSFRLERLECTTKDENGETIVLTETSGSGRQGIAFSCLDMTQTQLQNNFNRSHTNFECAVRNFGFQVGQIEAMGDPRIDPGDVVIVKEILHSPVVINGQTIPSGDTVTYPIPAMSLIFGFDGGLYMSIESFGEADSETISDIKGPSAKEIDRIAAEMLQATYLIAKKIDAAEVEAQYARITSLDATNARIDNLDAGFAKITMIEGDLASFKQTTTDSLDATSARIENLYVNYGDFVNLTAENFQAVNADIDSLEARQANFETLATERLTATSADIQTLTGDIAAFKTGDFANLSADVATFQTTVTGSLRAINADIDDLKAGAITTTYLEAHYAQIDLSNVEAESVTTAMIQTGAIETAQIADGSITDAKIVGLTANKITAGTLDAGVITVTNLNADNITTGTINGQRIAQGAVSLDKLASDVTDNISQALDDAGFAIQRANSSVARVEFWYIQTNSDTVVPDSDDDGWSQSAPSHVDGKYIWEKRKSITASGTATETDPVCISGKDGTSPLLVHIDSSAGTSFHDHEISTLLVCTVYYGLRDVTSNVTRFTWKKRLKSGEIDQNWSNSMTGNQILITASDVQERAVFLCEVTVEI